MTSLIIKTHAYPISLAQHNLTIKSFQISPMSRLKSHEFTPSKFCHTKTVSWAFFLNCLTQCLCFHLPKTLKKAFTLKWSWSMTAQFLVLTSLPRYSTVVQTDCCQNISLRNMSSCIYNIVHFQTMHTVG